MSSLNKSLKANALLNVIKQISSILFPMITFPFASRILGVENYGKVNFSYTIISYITLIAGLGISNYAIREGSMVRNDRKKLKVLVNELYSINVVSTLIAYIILGILVLFWKKLNEQKILIMVQSISILFITLGTDWINSIFEDYSYITVRYIICQSIAVTLMIVFVKNSSDYIIYALTSISSIVIANILNIKYIRNKYDIHPHFILEFNYKLHLKPVMLLFGSAVASLIYVNSDITILGILKDDYSVGLYSVSSKIYTLVKQVMNAVLIVVIPRISNKISETKIEIVNQFLNDIFADLLIVIGPACTGLFMLSENIILLFSGQDYYEAASSLKILSGSLICANLACFFINVVLIPYKKEREVLKATIISAFINILLNLVLIPLWAEKAAAFTTLISEALMLIVGFIYSRDVFKITDYKQFFVGLANTLATLLTCYIVKMSNISNLPTIVILISLCLTECGLITYLLDRKRFLVLVNLTEKIR